jgi:hypothetical protein
MTPEQFIATWRGSTRTERSAAQEHFLGLCELLEVKKPQEEDPRGAFYTFEKNVLKLDGRPGRADVWRKGCFAWEYKGPKKSLVAAYAQLKEYADALENPPLLIVSDMEQIRVQTNFTNSVSVQKIFRLGDLTSVEARQYLRNCFIAPEKLRPNATRETVTHDAAKMFGDLAAKLRKQYDARRVAHFLNRLVFCFYVEDIGLLPGRIFAEILEESVNYPDQFVEMMRELFVAMKDRGGRFGTKGIRWFNGGLFDDADVLPLGGLEILDLSNAAGLDWSAIEPSIFGTMFEAGLDPGKREVMASLFEPGLLPKARNSPLGPTDRGIGIHYTDTATIMKIIEPVVLAPLRNEWDTIKAEIIGQLAKAKAAKSQNARNESEATARSIWHSFRERLGNFRVLDPACGSGNFLYLSLYHLKDFDLQVLREGAEIGLPADFERITPDTVCGIEINPYGAELARTTIWIGELQWQIKNCMHLQRSPILGRLDQVECRDALLDETGAEASWPPTNVIVGNPPFLGGKRMRTMLGSSYVDRLFATFGDRVPGEADLVSYWFEKSRNLIKCGNVERAGLVATQAIRRGASLKVLRRVREAAPIFAAWSDEPWAIDGAAVRVSLIGFGKNPGPGANLNGAPVGEINADLSAASYDIASVSLLDSNRGIYFQGVTKGGAFDIDAKLAREWLEMPRNANSRPNLDVVRPWMNGSDLVGRPQDHWIIDFGPTMSEQQAALYEAPFRHVLRLVKPGRKKLRREAYRTYWWRHVEARPGMRRAISNLSRYIATPRVSKHRVFAWVASNIVPDSRLVVIASGDDALFGVLQSRFHKLWALAVGSIHGDGDEGGRPTYTADVCFGAFPFPSTVPLTQEPGPRSTEAQRIADAAIELVTLRDNWLNPSDLVRVESDIDPSLPKRIIPLSEKAEEELRRRTLTNLYNQNEPWLQHAHAKLDAAVAKAYRWPEDISDADVLATLTALNATRIAAQRAPRAPRPDSAQPEILLSVRGGRVDGHVPMLEAAESVRQYRGEGKLKPRASDAASSPKSQRKARGSRRDRSAG